MSRPAGPEARLGTLLPAARLAGLPPAARLATLLVVLLLAGCRDAAEPFQTLAAGEPAAVRRLTAGPGDDRFPVWSPGGDTVYYAAGELEGLPESGGVLAAVPRAGGAARTVLPSVQFPGSQARTLLAPAASPDGGRLAFVHRFTLLDPRVCATGLVRCDPASDGRAPRLATVVVYARALSASSPLSSSPSVRLDLGGRVFDGSLQPEGLTGTWIVRYEPFQRAFDEDGTLAFRPSWSPDGSRVVFGDGLRLLAWEPGAGDPAVVPGTADGVSAAWGPDGAWIAFTRLVRGAELASRCEHIEVALDPRTNSVTEILRCVEERAEWPILARRLVLVRPDGSETRDLGDGDEPAWSPDGGRLYFRRADRIWRSAPDGSGEEPVADTEGGREPAVSPDGRELAFARPGSGGDHDIWVVGLSP